MNCQHDNRLTWLYAIGRKHIDLCHACKASLEALGMTFRERRVTDITPIVERRDDWKPAWMARLTAKELVG